MATRPQDLAYAVDETPPWPRLLVLGLQYAILIAVYLVVIVVIARKAGVSPETERDLIRLGFVAAAIGAIAQGYNGRFFGSGFLAPPVYSAIYLGPALLAVEAGGLPAVAGMTVFAGLVEIGLSFLLVQLRVVFQPVIAGFAVMVVGIQLGLVGIGETLDVKEIGKPDYLPHIAVALATLAACIGFSVWGRGAFKLVSILIGLAIGLVAAGAAGLINGAALSGIAVARWVALPDPTIVSYGFEPSLIPAFFAAALAATLRTIGVVTTCQRINDADWKRPDMANLRRGVFGDGVGCLAAGLFGVSGMSAAASLAGVSSATGATSRTIAYATGGFLLLFAFLPKAGAMVSLLPTEVAGAILVFTASFLVASGIEIMNTRGLDLRAGFALSIALLLGLLTLADPEYFAALPSGLKTITGDMLTVSLAAAILLTLLFRIGIRRSDVAAWRAADEALDDFKARLFADSKAWKLAGELVERAHDGVADLVRHLRDGRFLAEPGAITATYDGLELMVELAYRGQAMPLAHPHRAPPAAHAEAPATAGLGTFAGGVHADRSSILQDGDRVVVRLWFGA